MRLSSSFASCGVNSKTWAAFDTYTVFAPFLQTSLGSDNSASFFGVSPPARTWGAFHANPKTARSNQIAQLQALQEFDKIYGSLFLDAAHDDPRLLLGSPEVLGSLSSSRSGVDVVIERRCSNTATAGGPFAGNIAGSLKGPGTSINMPRSSPMEVPFRCSTHYYAVSHAT